MNTLLDILVAIKVIVYNHEPYLRDCLEGFVMQQTNFPFVAIVHDDASTDASAAIIREYEEKYPDIIKPIYETENQYSKHDGSLGRIINAAVDATGAKYVAMCEGDDYWTDLLKLQKQVDFMEANPEYSMCFHKVDVLSQDTKDIGLYDHLCEREYSAHEIYDRWTIPTCSVLYNRHKLKLQRPQKCLFGDIVLFLSLANGGKLFCLDFIGGVYRRHDGGASVGWSNEKYIALYHQYKEMEKLFPNVKEISTRRKNDFLSYVIHDVHSDDTWKYRFLYMWENKKLFCSYFFTTTILTYMIKPFIRKYLKKNK